MEPDHNLAALADYHGTAVSLDLVDRRLAARMPFRDAAPLTCMSVDAARDALLACYSDHAVVECCLRTGR